MCVESHLRIYFSICFIIKVDLISTPNRIVGTEYHSNSSINLVLDFIGRIHTHTHTKSYCPFEMCTAKSRNAMPGNLAVMQRKHATYLMANLTTSLQVEVLNN